MKNSSSRLRRVHQNNALATKGRSHGHAKRPKIYRNLRETAPKSTAIVHMQPNLRITPVMQAEILRFYTQGCTLCEIARRTGRARQTITKVVRAPGVEAMIRQQKERLVAESDAWVESINFAVRHETDGALAYKLSEVFGIIPSPSKKAAPVKPPDDWQGVDPQTLAKARILGQVALERGTCPPPDNNELEKLVRKDQVTVCEKVTAVR